MGWVYDAGDDHAWRPDDDDEDWSFDFPMFAVLRPDRTLDESGSTTSDFESSWVTTALGGASDGRTAKKRLCGHVSFHINSCPQSSGNLLSPFDSNVLMRTRCV